MDTPSDTLPIKSIKPLGKDVLYHLLELQANPGYLHVPACVKKRTVTQIAISMGCNDSPKVNLNNICDQNRMARNKVNDPQKFLESTKQTMDYLSKDTLRI